MTTTKGMIIFFICLITVVSGCGSPSPGYKIQRIDETVLVFLSMKDSSKILEAKIDDRDLHVEIDNGQEIEKRVMSLKKKLLFGLIESDETIKVQGINRINRYGVVHLIVYSPIPRRVRMSYAWSGMEGRGSSEKPGPFSNSGSFRIRDSITAYHLLPDRKISSWEVSNFGIRIKYETKTTIGHVVNEVNEGRLLDIKVTVPDVLIRDLTFSLNDLQPDETVEVKNQIKLGDEIFIAFMKVVPMPEEPTTVVSDRSLPLNNSTLIDR